MRRAKFSAAGAVFLTALILRSTMPAAAQPDVAAGELLVYDIGLLWFDQMAEGRLSFTVGDLPGTFQAQLEAATLGMAARLTGDRSHRYVSLMERGPDGRLRSLTHESVVSKGKGKNRESRGKRYYFDYAEGEVLYQRFKAGRISGSRTVPLDRANPPNDILTAFYNFRAGAFGPLIPGARYVIPAFSHKGPSDIVVETVPAEERHEYPFFPRDGLLARVTVDPEVFDTGGGHVFVWFDDAGRPARGIVENILGLGNVRGIMRRSGTEDK